MTTPSHAPPTSTAATRPLYWSVRRELWEHRSLYLAPLAVAAFVLFALSLSMIGLPHLMQNLPEHDPAKRHAAVVARFSWAPAPIMLATFVVGIFYCLDALHGERRDRSILFWKSLPVSDRTAVFSKACIPLVVLPLVAFVLGLAVQNLLLLLGSAVLLASGVSPAPLWSEFPFFQEPLVMLYGLAAHALWFAPLYGWLLLVSVWARRTPVLWASLPLLVISAVERIALGTAHFASLLGYRVGGAMAEAFALAPEDGHLIGLAHLDPARFLSSRGLWLGLVCAAAFVAGAARLRRRREPI
jgi:ABC-2 type transport system permease protein